jgi:hypothetical protein
LLTLSQTGWWFAVVGDCVSRRFCPTRFITMDILGALWHLLNFFAPAWVVGALAAALAKVFWRSELRGLTWLKLALRASLACAAVLVVGMVIEGRDGRMSTYLAMVLACAGALWWSLRRLR